MKRIENWYKYSDRHSQDNERWRGIVFENNTILIKELSDSQLSQRILKAVEFESSLVDIRETKYQNIRLTFEID